MNEATMYRKINKFMDKYQLNDAYPVMRLIQDLKIKLIPYDGLDLVPLMAISEDAFSVYDAGERYIFYNPYQPATRRNFTLAHELGHFVFEHHQQAKDAVLAYGARGQMETQANIFARNLLMPADVVRDYLGHKTTFELASIFDVSAEMAKLRVKHLPHDEAWLTRIRRRKAC